MQFVNHLSSILVMQWFKSPKNVYTSLILKVPSFLAAFCLLRMDMELWHFFVHFLPLNMARHNVLYQSSAVEQSGSAAQIHWAEVHETIVSGSVANSTSSWHGATLALLRSQNESSSQSH